VGFLVQYLPFEVHSIFQYSLFWFLLPVQTIFGASATGFCVSMSNSTTSLVHTTASFPPWLDVSIPEQEHVISSADAHRRNYQRAMSANSMLSSASVVIQPLRVRNDNVVPSRTISLSTIDFNEPLASIANHRQIVRRISHRSSWGTDIPVPPQPGDPSVPDIITDSLEDISLDANHYTPNAMNTQANNSFPGHPSELRLSFKFDKENVAGSSLLKKTETTKGNTHHKSHPFRRWIDTIHRKRVHRHHTLRLREDRWSLDDFDDAPVRDTVLLQSPVNRRHRKSTSWASSGFVTAVKSASMSLATFNVAPHSRKARGSTLVRSSSRSSRISCSFNRPSLDEASVSGPIIDEASRDRAIRRRRTLEELVDSEESYVADLKVLVNVGDSTPFGEDHPNKGMEGVLYSPGNFSDLYTPQADPRTRKHNGNSHSA